MRSIALNVKAELQPNGSYSLVVTVDGLTGAEHDRLASYLHDPLCEMLQLATRPDEDVCPCERCEHRREAVGRPPASAEQKRRLQ
jgi:hypothetical protein